MHQEKENQTVVGYTYSFHPFLRYKNLVESKNKCESNC